MRVLLTGAGGFVGSHVLEHLLSATSWDIVCTDSFRHKGRADRISAVLGGKAHWRPRVTVVTHDLAAPFTDQMIYQIGRVDYVFALAAESHVDRSIADPVHFTRNNVNVALSTLEYCRDVRPKALLWVSTDEVYGPDLMASGRPEPWPEWSPIVPSNPYAASKACQEAIAISYWRTYAVPLVICNIANMIGERQDPEKFVPMTIRKVMRGETVTIHGTEGNIGSRYYLHARNLADGLLYVLANLTPVAQFNPHPAANVRQADRPDRYNVTAPDRVGNLAMARLIAQHAGRPLKYELLDFHSARPGHDPHYGLDDTRLARAGWKPPVPFEESLARTVRWSLDNPAWLA